MLPQDLMSAYIIHKAVKERLEEAKNAPLKDLKELEVRSQVETTILLSEAKIAQELAIAERIKNSDEVEIEEFYDTSGKGNIGLNTEKEKILLGVSGEGRNITKRIIKFKGNKTIQKLNDDGLLESE